MRRLIGTVLLLTTLAASTVLASDVYVYGKAQTIRRDSNEKQPETLETNASLWMTFEEDDGTNFYCYTTNACDGLATNASTAPAWSSDANGSMECDGVDDYIETSGLFMDGLADYTLAAWVNLDDTNTFQSIAGWNENGSGVDENIVLLYVTAGSWAAVDERENTIVAVIDPSGAALSAWSHVAYTAVQNGNITLYVNGIEVAQSAGVGNVVVNQDVNLYLCGRNVDGTAGSFVNGTIGEERLYIRALASNEVWTIWNRTKAAH